MTDISIPWVVKRQFIGVTDPHAATVSAALTLLGANGL